MSSPLNKSVFRSAEIKITNFLARFVPGFIGTRALTLFSLISSLLMYLSYVLSTETLAMLLLCNIFIVLQWIFDCLDGTIGRLRNEGYVKWGFYMDHLFDYIFMGLSLLGLTKLIPIPAPELGLFFFTASLIMTSSFLFFASKKSSRFQISFFFISPIEYRILLIVLNFLLMWNPYLVSAVIQHNIHILILTLLVFFIALTLKNQKILSEIDESQ